MKKLIATAALLLLVPTLASAQNVDHVYHAEGYSFVADEATVGPAGGGGGEGLFSNGFGLGGEYVKAQSPFGENIISANMFYHFGPSTNKRRFEPFVTGGFNRFSISNIDLYPVFGWNFGCGANIWLKKHVGLRLEGRDTIGGRSISIDYEPSGNSYTAPQNVVSFRIGVTFR
jgi:hypothetical protein